MNDPREPVLELQGVVTRIGSQLIHDGVDLTLRRGEIAALIGGSGTGKSVLLREIIGLMKPSAGSIRLLGVDVWATSRVQLDALRKRFGMLFQDGALFSSLDVADNVATPLREHAQVPPGMLAQLVDLRLSLAGLSTLAGSKMPSELSGGMRKRAAIARALALEPEVLFLDEPTSGLDPITARAFDRLLRFLCDDLGITVLIVTHDLDTLLTITDRVIVLGKGRVIANGPVDQVVQVDDPWIRSYFEVRASIVPGALPD